MRQKIDGRVDIENDTVRVEIRLPLLLRVLANKITGRVRREAALLLDKPSSTEGNRVAARRLNSSL
jgi:hypothetical protein